MAGHTIRLFENNFGDSFIVEMYSKKLGRSVKLLFDMGKRVDELFNEGTIKDIDGIFVTHVDRDHIGGIISLLKKDKFKKNNNLTFIVFNTFNSSLISYYQGNQLFKEAETQNIRLIESYRSSYEDLNDSLNNLPLIFMSKEKRNLLQKIERYNEYIFITFLLPEKDELKSLMTEWQKDNIVRDSGKTDGVTNESSIVCLLEFFDNDRKISLLLTGDGFINRIHEILKKHKGAWCLEKIDCIKIPHHGSNDNNIGIDKLISEFGCNQLFYMSKNGVSIKDTLDKIPIGTLVIRGNNEKIESEQVENRLAIKECFSIEG